MHMFTDFNKEQLFHIYLAVKRFLVEDLSEDNLLVLEEAISNRRICLPDKLYNSLMSFYEEELSPLVYDYHNVFAENHTEEFGKYDDEGRFVIRNSEDDEITKRYIGIYLDVLYRVEKRFDEYAKLNLQPYLI